ncbi:MAG: stalk domain-containing protein [Candidatus Saccharibacteria bacterium]
MINKKNISLTLVLIIAILCLGISPGLAVTLNIPSTNVKSVDINNNKIAPSTNLSDSIYSRKDLSVELPKTVLPNVFIAAPAKLTAQVGNVVKVKLVWTDKSNNETKFIVERRQGVKPFTTIGTVAGNGLKTNVTITYYDINLPISGSYTYRVKAIGKGTSASAYSNTASAKVAFTKKVIKYQIGQTTCYINGQPLTMDAAPEISNNVCFIPVRWLCEPLGATSAWDQTHQKITMKLYPNKVEMVIGSSTAKVNGIDKQMGGNADAAPYIKDSRVMIPISWSAGFLGCSTTYDEALNAMTVTYLLPTN